MLFRFEQALGQGHALPQAPCLKAVIARLQPLGPGHLRHQCPQLVQPADGGMGGARTLLHGVRMAAGHAVRPVTSPAPMRSRPAPWPEGSQQATEALARLLSIDERQWHALKGQPKRRAAELLAAALVQLVNDGEATPMVVQALGWLQGELRDPGCPQHGR